MDRIKKSLRESFRRKKGQNSFEASKPIEWQADELAVRSGTCSFQVKYLGCTEVFESRGMQVCEEAFKVLKRYKRKPMRAVLHVGGEALRVVDKDSKGLIVDQTIEKVSFCAPDRNYDRGFSYICRDGATRRWMCHGFMAVKYSGERLSHAVGCAFAACLERKQARDKECGVAIKFDGNNQTSFTRFGSFKTSTITDKLNDLDDMESAMSESTLPDKPRELPVTARKRPTVKLDLLRQASFRGPQLTSKCFSPFKKQLSLRLMELPSTLQRREEYTSKDDYLKDLVETRTPLEAGNVATVFGYKSNGHTSTLANGLTNGYTSHHPSNDALNEDGKGGEDCIKRLCRQITQDFAPCSSIFDLDTYTKGHNNLTSSSNGPNPKSLERNGISHKDPFKEDIKKITNPFLESHNILQTSVNNEVNLPQSIYHSSQGMPQTLYTDRVTSYPLSWIGTTTPSCLDGRTAMVHPYFKQQPFPLSSQPPVTGQATYTSSTLASGNHKPAPLSTRRSNTNPFLLTTSTSLTHQPPPFSHSYLRRTTTLNPQSFGQQVPEMAKHSRPPILPPTHY